MAYDAKIFERQFRNYVVKHELRSSGCSTLVAVSGGMDSVVLAHLFYKAGFPFAIAHCNFGLRKEAAEEQAFVEALAQKYGVPCYTTSFPTRAYVRAQQVSVQMAARELRYTWFERLRQDYDVGEVATAHHVNDMMETFLRNVTKGTGITGLHGILPRYGHVVRPLLFATRREVMTYAEACGLAWKEDVSNRDIKYDRNFIRHRVVPQLKVLNPSLDTTFQTSLARLQQVDQLFQAEVAKLRETLWRSEPPYHYINVAKLLSIPWSGVILEAWLSPFGFNFKQLEPWLSTPPQPGKKLYTATHWLLADRKEWVVGERHRENPSLCSGDVCARMWVPLPSGSPATLTIPPSVSPAGDAEEYLKQAIYPRHEYRIPSDPYIAALDLDCLTFPLLLRPWQEGDIFYPLTSQKRYRKKVSDLLIDAKVPLHQKGNVKVLVSDGKIAWVVGHQIDDRFKVTERTKEVWEGVYKPELE